MKSFSVMPHGDAETKAIAFKGAYNTPPKVLILSPSLKRQTIIRNVLIRNARIKGRSEIRTVLMSKLTANAKARAEEWA